MTGWDTSLIFRYVERGLRTRAGALSVRELDADARTHGHHSGSHRSYGSQLRRFLLVVVGWPSSYPKHSDGVEAAHLKFGWQPWAREDRDHELEAVRVDVEMIESECHVLGTREEVRYTDEGGERPLGRSIPQRRRPRLLDLGVGLGRWFGERL